jgi:hypothetical protein
MDAPDGSMDTPDGSPVLRIGELTRTSAQRFRPSVPGSIWLGQMA